MLTFNLIKINNCDITKKLERILGQLCFKKIYLIKYIFILFLFHIIYLCVFLIGVNIDDIDENLTLGEMHVNDMVIEEIQSVICDRVTYSTEKLLEMTVGR